MNKVKLDDVSHSSVVILGSGINGLGIIRSFYKSKVSVYAMSWFRDYGMSSRFCKPVICPNPQNEVELVNFLIEFAKNFELKPVLFATSDAFLMCVISYKEKLSPYFHVPVCDWNILSGLIKKEFLYAIAENLGVLCPKTKIVKHNDDLLNLANDLMFPLIIKPSVNIKFTQLLGEKAYIVENELDLNVILEKIKKHDLLENGIIIQEYIPGEALNLYTITSYANANNDILGYSIGHKIRQYPPQTGTIISGRIEHVEEILESALKFIKGSNFYGISNIEYKFDSRDNKFKLMEINPRTGVWNLSALRSGVNLPLMAYNDVVGNKVEFTCNHSANFVWMIFPLDLYHALWGFKKKGYPNFSISFKEWLKSVKGKKVDACFKWNDPKPFFKRLCNDFPFLSKVFCFRKK